MYNNLMDSIGFVAKSDPEVAEAMNKELGRQRRNLELIASENIVSPEVMAAMGSVLTNKYAEGYPGKRYYGGCEYVDIVENIAIERAKKLFGAQYANVQAHSGAQANTAVYFAVLEPGDTVLGMSLAHGGHLTHGSPVNLSGKYFNFIPYGLNDQTGMLDYDEVYMSGDYPVAVVVVRKEFLEHNPEIVDKYLSVRYSKDYVKLISSMLQIKEKNRPDFIELENYIQHNYYHKENIKEIKEKK